MRMLRTVHESFDIFERFRCETRELCVIHVSEEKYILSFSLALTHTHPLLFEACIYKEKCDVYLPLIRI